MPGIGGFGDGQKPFVWDRHGEARAAPQSGVHVAFTADNHETVD